MRCLVAFLIVAASLTGQASARPQYRSVFRDRYVSRTDPNAWQADCSICHPQRSKKVLGTFGRILEAELPRRNERNRTVILAALDRAVLHKDPSSGQTFAQLLARNSLDLTTLDADLRKQLQTILEQSRYTERNRRRSIRHDVSDLAGAARGYGFESLRFARFDGTAMKISESAGRLIVLHFWDYRGSPAEPYGNVGFLDHWAEKNAKKVVTYGVVVAEELNREWNGERSRANVARDARKFIRFMKLRYPILLDSNDVLRTVGDPRRVQGSLPLTVVLSADLTVLEYIPGAIAEPDLPRLTRAVAQGLKEQK